MKDPETIENRNQNLLVEITKLLSDQFVTREISRHKEIYGMIKYLVSLPQKIVFTNIDNDEKPHLELAGPENTAYSVHISDGFVYQPHEDMRPYYQVDVANAGKRVEIRLIKDTCGEMECPTLSIKYKNDEAPEENTNFQFLF